MRLYLCVPILALALTGCVVRSGTYGSSYDYGYGYGYGGSSMGMYSGFYSPFYDRDSVYVRNVVINKRHDHDRDRPDHKYRPGRNPHKAPGYHNAGKRPDRGRPDGIIGGKRPQKAPAYQNGGKRPQRFEGKRDTTRRFEGRKSTARRGSFARGGRSGGGSSRGGGPRR